MWYITEPDLSLQYVNFKNFSSQSESMEKSQKVQVMEKKNANTDKD